MEAQEFNILLLEPMTLFTPLLKWKLEDNNSLPFQKHITHNWDKDFKPLELKSKRILIKLKSLTF